MTILLATSNPGKIAELSTLLKASPVTLNNLKDLPDLPDFPEEESTFEANAAGKARWFCERTDLPTIADDGGLEIDALDGWPGVHSRRIFGDGRRGTDEELVQEVLRRMIGIPQAKRGCQMRVVLAFAAPDGISFSAEGMVRGTIAETPSERRIPGYPFRSLFVPLNWNRTVGDVEAKAEAGVMTQRRDALKILLPKLEEWLKRGDNKT